METASNRGQCLADKRMCDLTGQRFGRLTALEPTEKRMRTSVVWRCQCDCGNIAEVNASSLRSGGTKSCGCLKKESAARIGAEHRADITGKVFERLTALEPTKKRQGTAIMWKCQCECGNTVYVSVASLNAGETKSCGCLQRDVTATIGSYRRIDLTGQRFGRLVVLETTKERRGSSVVWKCQCDCGEIAYVSSRDLRGGRVSSCGCKRRESRKALK